MTSPRFTATLQIKESIIETHGFTWAWLIQAPMDATVFAL